MKKHLPIAEGVFLYPTLMPDMDVRIAVAFEEIRHEHRPGRLALAASFLVGGAAENVAQLFIGQFGIAEGAAEFRKSLHAGIVSVIAIEMVFLNVISDARIFEYLDYFSSVC